MDINRKTRERDKRRKEGARDRGIIGREKDIEWRGKEKKEQKKGKGGGERGRKEKKGTQRGGRKAEGE